MTRRRQTKQPKKCYMCEELATSREHVPPECFFPTRDDFPDLPDMRKDLITVPSCDEHNLAKSGDDEYLLFILLPHYENNSIAQKLFLKKVIRAIKRRPWLAFTFFRGLSPVLLRNRITGSFLVNRTRFDFALERIARGVHFHHFKRKITSPAGVMSYSLIDDSSSRHQQVNAMLQQWRYFSEGVVKRKHRHGQNPSIFYYHVFQGENDESVAFRLVFYEGVVIDVLFSNELAPPRRNA